jgi:hypothetical protein
MHSDITVSFNKNTLSNGSSFYGFHRLEFDMEELRLATREITPF